MTIAMKVSAVGAILYSCAKYRQILGFALQKTFSLDLKSCELASML